MRGAASLAKGDCLKEGTIKLAAKIVCGLWVIACLGPVIRNMGGQGRQFLDVRFSLSRSGNEAAEFGGLNVLGEPHYPAELILAAFDL